MTSEEKDRLIEIIFYYYFNNKTSETVSKKEFWEVINSICKMYCIDILAITKAVRTLMSDECVPREDETYYLMHKAGMTVRPIRKLTGIYWQKQKQFEEEFVKNPITIHRKIPDVLVKRNIRCFIKAMYDLSENFFDIGGDILKNIIL